MYRDYVLKELEKRDLMVNFSSSTIYKKRKVFDGYKKLISFKDEESLMEYLKKEYGIQDRYLYMFVNCPKRLYKEETGKFAKKCGMQKKIELIQSSLVII